MFHSAAKGSFFEIDFKTKSDWMSHSAAELPFFILANKTRSVRMFHSAAKIYRYRRVFLIR